MYKNTPGGTPGELPIKTFGQQLPNVKYEERPGAYAFLLNVHREVALVKTSFGFFLPGGGLDPGEDEVNGLARELYEEIGYTLVDAEFLMKAAQFHWSEFYGKHFKKVGSFFEVEASPPPSLQCADGHSLHWAPLDLAARDLTQEFQRWAVGEFAKLERP